MNSFKLFLEEEDQTTILALQHSIVSQFPGLSLELSQRSNSIHIHEIRMPKEMRNKGIGTQAIQAVQRYAQSVGLPITLSPEAERGSKTKLLNFYKQLGFYHNYGRRKDYSLGGTFGPTWVWRPNKG